ncbi:MAG: coproporphyrinogen dehydrogenase HemZ [Clostridiales bacterium]|nr:coproporphyrinogen dehydrogenase HemZ [Clostridiales bacterium]
MLTIRCIGHTCFYQISDIVRLFTGIIPTEKDGCILSDVPYSATIESISEGPRVVTRLVEGFPELSPEDRSIETVPELPVSREVKRQLYILLSKMLEVHYPWGSLTGIRPTQVAGEVEKAEDLSRIYNVREDKAELAFLTHQEEERILSDSKEESLHIYIGIPFCPSRCAYCSFVAQEAPKKRDLLPSYVDAVLSELDLVLPNITHPIETLYIGGGTPTVLDEALFERFITGVFSHPELKDVKEVTVEAGRPDTITEAKLQTLRKAGITRICINPQTLCDATLLRVGRKHTAKDFEDAFQLARKMGFAVINTDLIAGLPKETPEEFCDSLSRIIELGPENITVHSLSKKRRSDLSREEIVMLQKEDLSKMEKMLTFASSVLSKAGYVPYYLYKQKDTLGGHENVGYQKGNTGCLYNVAMMGDKRSVLSFGAGGMSKRIFPSDGQVRIERCPCVKEPTQYIRSIEEIAQKKIRFFE